MTFPYGNSTQSGWKRFAVYLIRAHNPKSSQFRLTIKSPGLKPKHKLNRRWIDIICLEEVNLILGLQKWYTLALEKKYATSLCKHKQYGGHGEHLLLLTMEEPMGKEAAGVKLPGKHIWDKLWEIWFFVWIARELRNQLEHWGLLNMMI